MNYDVMNALLVAWVVRSDLTFAEIIDAAIGHSSEVTDQEAAELLRQYAEEERCGSSSSWS